MAHRVRPAPAPTGWRRRIARAPIRLYRMHLGALLGSRMLLLTHTGRTSGQSRQTVLEVTGRHPETGAYLVASGFGTGSQWYRNIRHTPRVTVQIGRRRMAARARPLTPDESGRAMARYATQRPRAASGLMRVCGIATDGTAADYYTVGHDYIPFVELVPDATDPLPRG